MSLWKSLIGKICCSLTNHGRRNFLSIQESMRLEKDIICKRCNSILNDHQ